MVHQDFHLFAQFLDALAFALGVGCRDRNITPQVPKGRLDPQRFHNLEKLNTAIHALLVRVNDELPIRRLGQTWRQLLEALDRPA